MVEPARPSWAAIARRLSPSAFSTASHSRSSRRRCVPPDIAPSQIAVAGQSVTTTPRDVALHTGFRRGAPERGARRLPRSEEHTSELQSRQYLVCRLLLEKKKT